MPDPLSGERGAIGADEFARLMQPFGTLSQKVAIAVSGGADSLSLAFCVKRWAVRDCVALIVDHGLRPESATEAERTSDILRRQGISSEVLRWEHEAIQGRLHEKARVARYELLIAACKRLGVGTLFLAHHRDDQAETVLMRLAKGSGIEGLAGMASDAMRDGVRLLRPLLSFSKTRLLDTCTEYALDFIKDPSNASERFARGRLRKVMPLLEAEGMTTESLIRLSTKAREVTEVLEQATQVFLKKAVSSHLGGALQLNRAFLQDTPRAILLRGLSDCLRYVRPGIYPPSHDGLSDILNAIFQTRDVLARSFYGSLLSITQDHITIMREPAGATESVPLRPGHSVLWDNRWIVTAETPFPEGTLKALGSAPHVLIDQLAPRLRQRVPQGRVRAGLPALWVEGKIVAIPSFEEKAAFHMVYSKQAFP